MKTSYEQKKDRAPDEDSRLFTSIGTAYEAHEIMMQQAARLANLGYFVFNMQDNIVEVCSERHASIFGLKPHEFIDRVTGLKGEMSMIHPDDVDLVRSGYDRLSHGETIELDYRFYRKDGSLGYIREFVSPERNAEGYVVRGLGSSLDVTETRLSEEKRAQANRLEALGELTAGVAHDFNNLLAVVLGNAELVQALNADQEASLCLSEIIEAAKRGGSLTRNLLNFAQRATIFSGPTDLNEEVIRAAETFQRASLRKANVAVQIASQPLNIHLDKDQLQTMLLNLLINARDAINSGGHIQVRTSKLKDQEARWLAAQNHLPETAYCLVEISDDGSGIPEALLSRITEPFFTTKSRAEGSGLGLSMAIGFAQQSNGTLDVSSEEGVGTSVKVYFPLTDVSSAVSDKAQLQHAEQSTHKHILVLEDEGAVLALLLAQLEKAGFLVTTAETAEEALTALKDRQFDIAILDNIIPGQMSGIDVAEHVKGYDERTKTILLSGYVGPELEADLPQIDSIIQKPVPFDELLQVIHNLIETDH